jgi:hypothetical protein
MSSERKDGHNLRYDLDGTHKINQEGCSRYLYGEELLSLVSVEAKDANQRP